MCRRRPQKARGESGTQYRNVCPNGGGVQKNEESARKLVQNDSAAMKEIRQTKLESGSTVCSEASTAVVKGFSVTF